MELSLCDFGVRKLLLAPACVRYISDVRPQCCVYAYILETDYGMAQQFQMPKPVLVVNRFDTFVNVRTRHHSQESISGEN